jgi:hypothetical protein
LIGAMAAAFLLMLSFPDTMGGGWTHFRRFVPLTFFSIILFLGVRPLSDRLKLAVMGVAALASFGLVVTTVYKQYEAQIQSQPLSRLASHIGKHCSVLPIVLNDRPVAAGGEPVKLHYEPFFQAPYLLGIENDRVVLFNYLARLKVYPVHFNPSMEPQQQLFHWKPNQEDVKVKDLDIDGFERSSGLSVDYILVWGPEAKAPLKVREELEKQAQMSKVVFEDRDSGLKLYQRPKSPFSLCVTAQASRIQAQL